MYSRQEGNLISAVASRSRSNRPTNQQKHYVALSALRKHTVTWPVRLSRGGGETFLGEFLPERFAGRSFRLTAATWPTATASSCRGCCGYCVLYPFIIRLEAKLLCLWKQPRMEALTCFKAGLRHRFELFKSIFSQQV